MLVRSVSLEIKYPPAQRMRPTEEGGEGGERGIERQRTGCGGLGVWQQRVLCAGGHRGQRIIALGVERGALFGSPRAKDNKERKEHEDAIGAGPLATGKFQRGGRHPEQAAEQAAGNSNVVRRARAAHLSGRHAIGSRRRQTHISHNPPPTHARQWGAGARMRRVHSASVGLARAGGPAQRGRAKAKGEDAGKGPTACGCMGPRVVGR